MKTRLAALLMCCAIGSGLKAQSSPFSRLKTVDIVVEDTSNDAVNLGLTRADIESVALVALKSKLPKLSINEKGGMSYVYINVTLVCAGYVCAANADVALERPTTMLEDDHKTEIEFKMANVWHVNMLFVGPQNTMSHRVKEYIDDAITSFAAEWYKANP